MTDYKHVQVDAVLSMTSAIVAVGLNSIFLGGMIGFFKMRDKLTDPLCMMALGCVAVQYLPVLVMFAFLGGHTSSCQPIMRAITFLVGMTRLVLRAFLLLRLRFIFTSTKFAVSNRRINIFIGIIVVLYMLVNFAMLITNTSFFVGSAPYGSGMVYLCRSSWPAALPLLHTMIDIILSGILTYMFVWRLIDASKAMRESKKESKFVKTAQRSTIFTIIALVTDLTPAVANVAFGAFGLAFIGMNAWVNSMCVAGMYLWRPLCERVQKARRLQSYVESGDAQTRSTVSDLKHMQVARMGSASATPEPDTTSSQQFSEEK